MSESVAAKGSCVCGAVTLSTPAMKLRMGVCHCGTCRKWAAGPFLSVDCGTDVTIEGEEHVGIYESSKRAQRAFCKNCGTKLFYRFTSNGQTMASASLFGEIEGLAMTHQVFVDERPAYYQFANETLEMTGAEVIAKFGG